MPAPAVVPSNANQINVGDVVRVEATFVRATDGLVVDPSQVALAVRHPGGAEDDWTYDPLDPETRVVRELDGDGNPTYHANVIVDESGLWKGRFVGSGDNAVVEPFSFYVTPLDF